MSSIQVNNALIYIKQTIVTTIIPFITTLIIVRFLTPEDFGVFALSIMYATVLLGIVSLGMNIGYERNYFEYQDSYLEHNSLFCSVQLTTALLFFISIFLSWIFVSEISRLINIESPSYVLLLVLAGHAFDKLTQYYLTYYRNAEKSVSYTKIMISQVSLNSVITLVAVIYFEYGVVGLAIGYFLSWFLVYTSLTIKWLRINSFMFDVPILIEVVKLSIPITPRSLTALISTQSDKYMLGAFKGVGDVGVYSIAARIGSVVNSFMIAIQNVYVPYLFAHMFKEGDEDNDHISNYLVKITYISVFPALLVILASYEIVWILLPEAYSHANIVLAIFALYYGLVFFGKITSKQMLYAKKTGVVSLLSIIFAIVNVLLNIPLIFYFGIVGAVVATLLTGSAATLVSYILAQRYKHLPWNLGAAFQIITLLLLSLSLIIIIDYMEIDYYLTVFLKIFILCLYIIQGVKLGVINKASIKLLIQQLGVKSEIPTK